MSLVSTLLRQIPEKGEEDKFPKNASPASPDPAWTCSGCGRRVPLTEETAEGRRRYLCPNSDRYISIPQEPGKPYIPSAKEQPYTPGNRAFLSHPIGQEDGDVWDAWTPFMLWLLEFHPDHFHAVCEAEEAIQALERSGITAGREYEQACAELLWRFETARRLKMSEATKIWVQ